MSDRTPATKLDTTPGERENGAVWSIRQAPLIALIAICLAAGGAQAVESFENFQLCVMCHGEDGLGQDAGVPIIAGTPAVVQVDALLAYRNGERNCETPKMCRLATRLSDDEIVVFASYYAGQRFQPAKESFDPELAEQGETLHAERCIKCHGDENRPDPVSGILFGQRTAYLRYALGRYAAGERHQLPAMEIKTAGLSSDQIEALLNYYARHLQ